VKEKFTKKLQSEPREFLGRKVGEVVRKDGWRLVFGDGSWICYRLPGAEPVARVYSEAANTAELAKLSTAAKQWIFE
jgi:phosphoglucomutase